MRRPARRPGMPVSASSTCARTIVPAPPSRRSVSTRSSREPAVDLLVPDPLHHELQVGGLDAHAVAGLAPPPARPRRSSTRPRRTSSSTASTSAGSMSHPASSSGRRRLNAATGSTTAPARGVLVEEVEMQVVAVDVRDAALEPLPDERVGVLAHGDEEVRRHRAVDDACRELVVEGVARRRCVQEALLELIEDHEHGRVGRDGHVLDRVRQAVAPWRRRLRRPPVRRAALASDSMSAAVGLGPHPLNTTVT